MRYRTRRALPGGTRAAHIAAGAVLAVLALTAGIGWLLAPGDEATPMASSPAGQPQLEFTATVVSTGGITTATGFIIVVLIIGAGLIGRYFFGPKTPRRPRRSEAAVSPSILPARFRPESPVEIPAESAPGNTGIEGQSSN
ncbi:hypothetical protein BJY24_003789 [Nocardia transvalensis]|uniref:Uncharacterized protein n=1 Tax=Nocardia transvalensis TaxID=37333 RepID=A0A7W9PF38_9NOCA|nr:hypothetical protein [Nocardia transvalensis]MBB5914922.1 hypothetical protein [Nocardia transvalensis]